MKEKALPTGCPGCGQVLRVKRLECDECGTAVEGDFELPALARLNGDDQEFVLRFVQASGSLKEMARAYSVSYPTMRNRLDALIERTRSLKTEPPSEEEESQ